MAIRKYGRYWALYDDPGELVCICLHKKGAAEVLRRLHLGVEVVTWTVDSQHCAIVTNERCRRRVI
jgi:hypothetical protein